MFIVIFSAFSNIEVNAQYVKNGSFEEHREGQYPIGMSSDKEYQFNEFMKCLNLNPNNQQPYIFPPPESYLINGWYLPTKNGSSDYYHKSGIVNSNRDPQIPEVRFWYQKYDTLYPQIIGIPNFDSAYVGLGIQSFFKDGQGNQEIPLAYKEYIQSKLNTPLVSGRYHISFDVIRSRNSKALRSICAFFSSNAILNPNNFQTNWSTNLAYETPDPYYFDFIYINKTQHNSVCSDGFILNSTEGGSNGYNEWFTVSGFLDVPQDSIYNYITIGNFQKEYDLMVDYISNPINVAYDDYHRIYYYIDNIEVIPAIQCTEYPCHCPKDLFKFDITKDLVNSDSIQCCYNVNYTITDGEVFNGTCPISKIQLKKNSDVILSLIPPDGLTYTEGTYTANFCVDKFSSSENNVFTLLYYTKDQNDEDTVLTNCVRDISLKCECDCGDFYSYPYPAIKPNIYFKKTNSNIEGKCCWDLMITYPDSLSSESCEFDLSNMYLQLENSVPFFLSDAIFSSSILTQLRVPSNYAYFQFPIDFKIKPGDNKVLLSMCLEPLQNDESNNIRISLLDYYSDTEKNECANLITQDIRCDTTTNCCDMFKLTTKWPVEWGNIQLFAPCLFEDQMGECCCIPLILEVVNTPTNCNLNDTFVVSAIYSNALLAQSVIYSKYFTPGELKFGKQFITYIPLLNGEMGYICIDVKNLTTNETCTKCDSAKCTINLQPADGTFLFYKSMDESQNSHNLKDIIYQNNSLKFNFSSTSQNSIVFVEIFDINGRRLYNSQLNYISGIYEFKSDNIKLANGTYFLSLSIDNNYSIYKFLINN